MFSTHPCRPIRVHRAGSGGLSAGESAHELAAARLELVKAQAHSAQLAAAVAQEREERREAQEGATQLRETLSRLEERVALLQGPRPSASSPGLATE